MLFRSIQNFSEFLAGLSHQLGAPINQLAEILDRTSEAQTGESLEQLETAQRCADTLLTLLNQLRPEVQVDAATGVTRR